MAHILRLSGFGTGRSVSRVWICATLMYSIGFPLKNLLYFESYIRCWRISMTYCPNCRGEVPPGMKFCGVCGSEIEQLSLREMEDRVRGIRQTQPPTQHTTSPPPYRPAHQRPQKKKDPAWATAVAVIFVIMVIIIGGVIFLDSQQPTPQPNPALYGAQQQAAQQANSDNDGDGISDLEDFYDSGNGGISVRITHYNGDGYSDESGELDPYFTIWIDVNGDGAMGSDELSRSQVYDDSDELDNPHSWTVDVPDDTRTIRIGMYVFDSDSSSDDDVIDVSPEIDYTVAIEDFAPRGQNQIFSHSDGSEDGLEDEPDATINYDISITRIG